ncbi:hypothetical protein [Nocardia heshunensis]
MVLHTQQERIPTAAYEALRNALPVVVWYKRTFRRQLSGVFREAPELLAALDFGQTKREVVDQIVERLLKDESRYRDTTVRVLLEIASMDGFPDLENHNDSELLVEKATAAVAEVRRYAEVLAPWQEERQRLAAERRAHEQQAGLKRKFAEDLAALKIRFNNMHYMNNVHERGRKFEPFLYDLFELFDLEPKMAYVDRSDQIDGAFSFDSDVYLLEAKWIKEKVSREQADAFAAKIGRRGKLALGLFVSINGLSSDAIRAYDNRTPFITMDGQDLYFVLESRVRLDDMLARKKRHANETGRCDCPASQWFS